MHFIADIQKALNNCTCACHQEEEGLGLAEIMQENALGRHPETLVKLTFCPAIHCLDLAIGIGKMKHEKK